METIKKHMLAIIFLMLFIISGCGGTMTPSFYINEDIDFSFIKKVAVLPLDNLTNDKFAADIVRHVVISELLASGLVEVTVPGDALGAIEKLKIKPGQPLSSEDIKAIGKTLKVQAVILGAVNKFEQVREGNVSFPEISITLMMADANSGSIIWSVTETRGGASFLEKNFGARTETMSETVLKVVSEALNTLYYY
jgi:TolB-like protein